MVESNWGRYPWKQYLQQQEEAYVDLRMPGRPWTPMYPDTRDRRTARSLSVYEEEVDRAWKRWLAGQREEARVSVILMFNELYRQLGLKREVDKDGSQTSGRLGL